MKEYNSNTELVQGLFDVSREMLEITLKIKEMIGENQLDELAKFMKKREGKIIKLSELVAEFEKRKCSIPDFKKIREELNSILGKILKIDEENSDNIKRMMNSVSRELREIGQRKKLLNYLR
jgi:hypothetical protein